MNLHHPPNIFSLYVPIQPVEFAKTLPYTHRNFDPIPALASYVQSFWELKGSSSISGPVPYPIVPDGSVDLIFSLREEDPCGYISVTGSLASELWLEGEVHLVGIRFFPGCFLHFFPFSFQALEGHTLEIREVFGAEGLEWEAMVLEAATVEEAFRRLSRFLLGRISSVAYAPDPRFLRSLFHILQTRGSARIESEVAEFISPRQLRRMFEHHTGLSPKSFSRVVRFQNVLRNLRQHPNSDWNFAAEGLGYFDQAHFIREFKAFAGELPSAFLRK
jgi:hypothetical protein